MYNFEKTVEQLTKWANGTVAYPVSATIFPTHKCNLNCRMCRGVVTRQSSNTTNDLQKGIWLKFVSECLSVGVSNWRITGGGEPLMSKEITYPIIKLIKKNRTTFCMLATNGTLIGREDARFLVQADLDKIEISVDGFEDGVVDYIRGKKGCLRRIEKAVRLISEYKAKSTTGKPLICFHIILNSLNYNKFRGFVKKWAGLGIDEIVIQSLQVYPETERGVSELVPKREEIEEFTSSLESLYETASGCGMVIKNCLGGTLPGGRHNSMGPYKEVPRAVKGNPLLSQFLSLPCFMPWYNILVDMGGNVNFCCSKGRGNSEVNIKTKTLQEVWFSEYFCNVREGLLTGRLKLPHDECRNCGETHVNITTKKMLWEAMKR